MSALRCDRAAAQHLHLRHVRLHFEADHCPQHLKLRGSTSAAVQRVEEWSGRVHGGSCRAEFHDTAHPAARYQKAGATPAQASRSIHHRRESLAAAKRAATRVENTIADARYALRRAEADLRAGVDGVRSQVEPRVQKLSGDVEARLAPIIAKLGLKPKTTRKARKPRKTATKAVRRTTRTPATRAPKKAAG